MSEQLQQASIVLSAPAGGVAGAQFDGELRLPPELRRADAIVKIQLRYQTEGKGDMDSGGFEYVISEAVVPSDPLRFSIALPREPWSYRGKILKINWTMAVCVELDGVSYGIERELVIGSPFVAR
jgi:hypothetical protein